MFLTIAAATAFSHRSYTSSRLARSLLKDSSNSALRTARDARRGRRTPAGLEQHVLAALRNGSRGQRRGVDEIARVATGRAQRAAQARERGCVEARRNRDHRVDALIHSQRAQVREHLDRDIARGVFVASEFAPVTQRHFVGPPAGSRQRGTPEARLASRRFDRERLVRDELAIAGDGQHVVVEVQAEHVRQEW